LIPKQARGPIEKRQSPLTHIRLESSFFEGRRLVRLSLRELMRFDIYRRALSYSGLGIVNNYMECLLAMKHMSHTNAGSTFHRRDEV
jgi:hypothetical protein